MTRMNFSWAVWAKASGATGNDSDQGSSLLLEDMAQGAQADMVQMDPGDGSSLSVKLSTLAQDLGEIALEADTVAYDPSQGYLLVFEAQTTRAVAASARRLLHLPALGAYAKALL
jgi:hypothetical protein